MNPYFLTQFGSLPLASCLSLCPQGLTFHSQQPLTGTRELGNSGTQELGNSGTLTVAGQGMCPQEKP